MWQTLGLVGEPSVAGGEQEVRVLRLRFAAGVCVLAAGLLMGGAGGAVAVADPGSSGSAEPGNGGTDASGQHGNGNGASASGQHGNGNDASGQPSTGAKQPE